MLESSAALATLEPERTSALDWLERVPDGVVTVEGTGRVRLINTRAQELLGVTRADVCGRTLREAFGTTDTWRAMGLAAETLATGSTRDEEVFHAGSLRWLRVHAVPSAGGVDVFLTDVSDRRQREDVGMDALQRERAARLAATRACQALARSEAQFRAMGETLPYGVWLADAQGSMRYASPSFEALVGAQQPVRDEAWLAGVHPADRDQVEQGWRTAVASKGIWDQDVRFVQPDGEVRDVLCRGMLVKPVDGEPPQWVGVHLDVTERKRTLEAQLVPLRAFLKDNPCPAAIKDLRGVYLDVNRAYAEGCGSTVAALRGHSDATVLGARAAETARAREAEALRCKDGTLEEETWSGSRRMLVARYPLRDREGTTVALGLWAVDITSLGAARPAGAAAPSEAPLKNLAGHVAAELNNILTSVVGHTSLAAEVIADGDNASDLLESSLVSCARAVHLAQQLQGYSGMVMRARGPLKPAEEVRALAETMDGFLAEGVRVQVAAEPRVPWVEMDPAHFRQVIMALMQNAGDSYRNLAGAVNIHVGLCVVGKRYAGRVVGAPVQPGRYALIEVKDRGCGMDAHTLERAFQPFFTTHPASRGMGLSCARGLVEAYGGGLEVHSEPGKGTTVRALLPAVRRAEDEAPPEPPRPARVAVLHSNPDTVRQVCRMLRQSGHHPMPAADLHAARAAMQAMDGGPDVVVVDASADLTVAEKMMVHLRREDPGVAVVLMAAPSESGVRARLRECGVDGFLSPHPTPDELDRTLADILDGHPRRSAASMLHHQ